MDALKILRALKEPDAIVQKIVADILPLLKDPKTHVVRDACRTLAVLGNKETIPFIEPLLKDKRSDVRKDAQNAIDELRAKS
jgi:HEAT repeat protein